MNIKKAYELGFYVVIKAEVQNEFLARALLALCSTAVARSSLVAPDQKINK